MDLHKLQSVHFTALESIRPPKVLRTIAKILAAAVVIVILFLLFVPWVQTAYGTGKVTALSPEQRPQPLNAMVSGRIKKWYVEDGTTVKTGDPIIEIVDNDADFILRLQEKRNALERKLTAAKEALMTAESNLKRQKELFRQGLSSEKTYEQARITRNSKQLAAAQAEADFKQAKVQLSQQSMQIIYAPRDGFISHVIAGEKATTIKQGQRLATFTPTNVEFAVELYLDGLDIPLVQVGRKVRLQFEGWPIVQFSGWPSKAVGTFGGIVDRVDPTISSNGRFRAMIIPDPDDAPWPDYRFLRLGSSVKGWVSLETVSVGYELWRNLNNFPPEFPNTNPTHENNAL